MTPHQQVLLRLHQERIAELRAAMLMLELGAGLREPVKVAAAILCPREGA